MSQMLKSSGAMALATLTSRVLGMARVMLYAWFMGAGAVAGAFTMAFMIPNLFRRLLGEGALTAAFIPLFKEKEKTEGEAKMWETANAVISGLIVAASGIIAVVMIGVTVVLAIDGRPLPAGVLASADPGFLEPGFLGADTRLMLELLRLMFPYLLLVCLAAVFMGMLNSRGHFFVPALGAVVLNGIMIVVVVFLTPFFGERLETQIFALGVGVLIAGVAQAIFQMPLLRSEGFRYRWVSPWKHDAVQVVVRRMIPGMMGVAAFQLNVLVTTWIAFAVAPEIVASFDYAVRLMELPQGMFGISLATYLLPTLTALASDKKYPEFRSTLSQATGYLAFANLIASVLLLVLAEPIMRLLFQRGAFGVEETERSAFALACLAPGLIAFSMVNILARAFYALGDTKTPMTISSFCLAVNIVFVAILIVPLREGGLGIANSLSAALNVGLLFYALRRKLKFLDFAKIRSHLTTMVAAAVLSGEVAWIANRIWDRAIGHSGLVEKLGAVFIPTALAAVAYGVVLLWFQVPQAIEFQRLLSRKLGSRRAKE